MRGKGPSSPRPERSSRHHDRAHVRDPTVPGDDRDSKDRKTHGTRGRPDVKNDTDTEILPKDCEHLDVVVRNDRLDRESRVLAWVELKMTREKSRRPRERQKRRIRKTLFLLKRRKARKTHCDRQSRPDPKDPRCVDDSAAQLRRAFLGPTSPDQHLSPTHRSGPRSPGVVVGRFRLKPRPRGRLPPTGPYTTPY